MFFRRQKQIVHSFTDRLSDLASAGFQSQSLPNGRTLVTRNGVGTEISESGETDKVNVLRSGVMVGSELGQLDRKSVV